MLTEHVEINFAPEGVSAETSQVLTAVLEVCRGLPVPVFKDKSSKQQDLDLAHSILNATVEYWLHHVLGWERQVTIAAVTAGVSDERKSIDFVYTLSDGQVIAIEIQFGNGGRIQADFAKFRTLHAQGRLALGVAVYFKRKTAETADSGLATYEAALQDLHKFGDMPVALVGLSRDDTAEVDLREIQGITFPAVLGGSGTNRWVLHQSIAQAIAEGTPMALLTLSPDASKVVSDQAIGYITKLTTELKDAYTRVLGCTDPKLRALLLAMCHDMLQHTWMPQEERNRIKKDGAEVCFEREVAAKRAKAAATEAKRKAREAEKKAAQKAADKQARKAERAALKAAAAGAPTAAEPVAEPATMTAPAVAAVPDSPTVALEPQSPSDDASVVAEVPETALAQVSPAVSAQASESLEPPEPRRVRRVTKAEEQARQAQAAEASKRKPVRPAAAQPTGWSAMSTALAQAFSGENKKK